MSNVTLTSLTTIAVSILISPCAGAFEFNVLVPTGLYDSAPDIATVIRDLEEGGRDENHLRFIQVENSSQAIRHVLAESADFGVVHAGSLARIAHNQVIAEADLGLVLASEIGFRHSSAAEMVEMAQQRLGNASIISQIVPLAIVPTNPEFAMWNGFDWDGDFSGDNARYDLVFVNDALGANPQYDRYFTRAVTFSPYVVVTREDVLRNISTDDYSWIQSRFDTLAYEMAAAVDERTDVLKREFSNLGHLEPVQFVPSPGGSSGDELLQSFLRMLGDGDLPLGLRLQCTSGTCPCGGTNSCDKACC